jgi:hypothetical protein
MTRQEEFEEIYRINAEDENILAKQFEKVLSSGITMNGNDRIVRELVKAAGNKDKFYFKSKKILGKYGIFPDDNDEDRIIFYDLMKIVNGNPYS